MGKTIGDILPHAVAVAISCVPIVAMILILFSQRAKLNGLAMLLGWIVGLGAVSALVYILAGLTDMKPDSGPSTTASIIKLVFGALFLALAVSYWFKRPKPGQEPRMPKWISAIDRLKPGMAFVYGVALSVVNVKNLPLTLATALTVSQAELGTVDAVIVFAVFVGIASVGMAVPVIFYLIAGERATRALDVAKTWLIENNATVMMVVFLLLAAVIIGKAVAELAG